MSQYRAVTGGRPLTTNRAAQIAASAQYLPERYRIKAENEYNDKMADLELANIDAINAATNQAAADAAANRKLMEKAQDAAEADAKKARDLQIAGLGITAAPTLYSGAGKLAGLLTGWGGKALAGASSVAPILAEAAPAATQGLTSLSATEAMMGSAGSVGEFAGLMGSGAAAIPWAPLRQRWASPWQ